MSPNVLKIRELFVAAVGKVPPDRWDAFVVEACGDRTELRREVLELLQAHRFWQRFYRLEVYYYPVGIIGRGILVSFFSYLGNADNSKAFIAVIEKHLIAFGHSTEVVAGRKISDSGPACAAISHEI